MICDHGQLARQCDYCEKDREIAELRQQFDACQQAGLKLAKQVGLAKTWLRARDMVEEIRDSLDPATWRQDVFDAALEHRELALDAFRQSVSGEITE